MATPHDEALVKQFLAYPFHEDSAFLDGVQLLLGAPVAQHGGPIPPQLDEALLAPKLFFFNRQHNTNLTPEMVTAARAPSNAAQSPDDEQLSLAELTRLIESGQTHLIPHNDVIPGGVQTTEPGPAKLAIRKKPWETDTSEPNVRE